MEQPGPAHNKLRKIVGYVIGVALVGAAAGYALSGVDVSVLGEAPGWVLVALSGLVLANLFLTAVLFWVVTLSFDANPRVGLAKMAGLIAVSGLLNYLPFVRAGLWGRAAYLKKYHGLPIRQSLVILAVILGVAVGVLGVVSAALCFTPAGWDVWFVAGLVGGALIVILPGVARRVLNRPLVAGWSWGVLRLLDLVAAAGRMGLVFWMLDAPISAFDAVLLTSASLVVKLVGLTPNGLGLSEWVVAALAAAITPINAATAAAAALIDRTVEVGVMLIAGAGALLWLRRDRVDRVANVSAQ